MSKFDIISDNGRTNRKLGSSNKLNTAKKRAKNLCNKGRYDHIDIVDNSSDVKRATVVCP